MLLSFSLLILAFAGNNEVFCLDEEGAQIKGRFAASFPYCSLGEDQYGAAVYFIPFGSWKFEEPATNGTDKEKEVLNLIVDTVVKTIKTEAGSKNRGVIYIAEATGLDVDSFLTPGVLQLAEKTFAKNSEYTKAIGKVFVINLAVPPEKLDPLWDALGELWSKTQVYGTNREEWEPQLLRNVPEDVLLEGYGGTTPVPKNCAVPETKRPAKLKGGKQGLKGEVREGVNSVLRSIFG